MDPEQPRLALGLSAMAGAAVWGVYTVVVALLARQTVDRRDLIHAGVNVLCAVFVGGAIGFFLGPVMLAWLPVALRDPPAVGFVIGFFAWEAVPLAIKLFRGRAGRFVKEKV